MGTYKANSTDSLNFNLTFDNQKIGELVYEKWYSFKANIQMPDGNKFQLEPKGFWESKIELKDATKTLLEFKMGWNGIIIKTFFNTTEESYLFKLKGLLGSEFILINTEKKELLVVECDFKWNKLDYDYTIETTQEFDNFTNKDLLLLTILHCINYYITITASAG
jgi:hypothetical protein